MSGLWSFRARAPVDHQRPPALRASFHLVPFPSAELSSSPLPPASATRRRPRRSGGGDRCRSAPPEIKSAAIGVAPGRVVRVLGAT
jgi:hypothetical protein